MGCFYSKMAPPPAAFTRDLSLSLKKRIADFTPFEDLLASRRSGGDQFLSLFYAANAVAVRLKSQDCDDGSDHSTDIDPIQPLTHETINTWELMADLEEVEGEEVEDGREQEDEEHGSKDRIFFAEGSATEIDNTNEDEIEDRPPSDLGDSEAVDPSSPAQIADSAKQDLTESEQRSKDCNFTTERSAGDEMEQRPPSDLATFDPPKASSSTQIVESGLRRKAAVKGLKLKVPSFDFSSGGELRRWIGEDGKVGCDGSYETPKFGSYGRRAAEDGGLFDPELVTELEEAMERLTEEE